MNIDAEYQTSKRDLEFAIELFDDRLADPVAMSRIMNVSEHMDRIKTLKRLSEEQPETDQEKVSWMSQVDPVLYGEHYV